MYKNSLFQDNIFVPPGSYRLNGWPTTVINYKQLEQEIDYNNNK